MTSTGSMLLELCSLFISFVFYHLYKVSVRVNMKMCNKIRYFLKWAARKMNQDPNIYFAALKMFTFLGTIYPILLLLFELWSETYPNILEVVYTVVLISIIIMNWFNLSTYQNMCCKYSQRRFNSTTGGFLGLHNRNGSWCMSRSVHRNKIPLWPRCRRFVSFGFATRTHILFVPGRCK